MPIEFIPPQQLRTLVRVGVIPVYDPAVIIPIYYQKINLQKAWLATCSLSLVLILQGYKTYQSLSLKYIAPLLSLPLSQSLLQPLYWLLLSKLKINRYFPAAIITIPASIGDLGLYSLEYESLVEVIGLLTLLSLYLTPSAVLIRDSLELLQLEAGISSLVLETDYSKFEGYIIK